MAESSAQVRMFSDDGMCVHNPVLMRRALEYVKAFDGVIAQHAQDPRLTEGAQMNEGVLSGELGLTGWPAVAEESIIARDVLLAEQPVASYDGGTPGFAPTKPGKGKGRENGFQPKSAK